MPRKKILLRVPLWLMTDGMASPSRPGQHAMADRFRLPDTLAWDRLNDRVRPIRSYRRMKLTGLRLIHERVTELAENIRGKAGG